MAERPRKRSRAEIRLEIEQNTDKPNYHGADKLSKWSPGSVAGGIQRGEECLKILEQYFYDVPLPAIFLERVDLLRSNVALLWQIVLTAEKEQWHLKNQKISRIPDGTHTAAIVTDIYAYLMKMVSDKHQEIRQLITAENHEYDTDELRGHHGAAFQGLLEASRAYTHEFSLKKLGGKPDYGYPEMLAELRQNYDNFQRAIEHYYTAKERHFWEHLMNTITRPWRRKKADLLAEWMRREPYALHKKK